MLDHVSIGVRDIARSARFYNLVLAPLGLSAQRDYGSAVAYGGTRPTFWIGTSAEGASLAAEGVHFAFTAPDRAAVDAFHAAALDAGGADDGKPRLRTRYHPDYYAAFIIDPDGHRIEAVCHTPA